MLQDEGKLKISIRWRVLAWLRRSETPSGKPANLTITQILTHTSGLGEATGPAAQEARTLAISRTVARAPMQYEPERNGSTHRAESTPRRVSSR